MSIPVNSGLNPKLLWPGVRDIIGLKYKMYEKGSEWKNLFDVEQSRQNYEQVVHIVPMGPAEAKPVGSPVKYDTVKQGYIYTYTHVTYARGMIIAQEEIEDNLYPEFVKARAGETALAIKRTEELVAAQVLNKAFDTGVLYGDGQALCAASRPLDSGATYSNTLAYGADLSENAIEQATIQIAALTDLRGNLIGVKPRKLIVAPRNGFQAARLLENPNRPETANRDINVVNKHNTIPEGYFVYHYQQLTTSWFILTDQPYGLTRMNRVGLETTQDNDFDTTNLKGKARIRFSVGCSDPGHTIFGVQGAI